MGILCEQLLLHFYANSFETFQVIWSWTEYVHGLDIILKLFLILFHKLLVLLSKWIDTIRQGEPGVHNSYNFILILLELYK